MLELDMLPDIPFTVDELDATPQLRDFEITEACYQVKIAEFGTSGCEASVVNLSSLRQAARRRKYSTGVWPETREERQAREERARKASARRAAQKVRHAIRQMPKLFTFTLSQRENVTDIDEFKRRVDLFRRRVKVCGEKLGVPLRYIAIPERQTRGAWHLHMVCENRLLHTSMIRVWNSVSGPTAACPKGGGYVHVRSPKGRKGTAQELAGYLSKYISKTFAGEGDRGAKKYWRTRDLPMPRVVKYLMPKGTTLTDAVRHVLSLGATFYADKKNWITGLSENPGIFWYRTD